MSVGGVLVSMVSIAITGSGMARILKHGNYGVFVLRERGHRHHRPHAHIKYGSQRVASVYLLTMDIFDQVERIPSGLMDLIGESQGELINAWEDLNRE